MIGQPYNPNNCGFVTNQAFNANQFNDDVPYSSNNTNHLVLWDFVDMKLLWVNSITNIIEAEIGSSGGSILPTNIGNLIINESQLPESTLVREYYSGFELTNTFTTVTGTDDETIAATLYIPANTFKINDVFTYISQFECGANTLDANGDSVVSVYHNSVPSIAGATLIDQFTIEKLQAITPLYQIYADKNVRKRINTNTSAIWDLKVNSLPFTYTGSISLFNITQNNYLIVTIKLDKPTCAFAVYSFTLSKVDNATIVTP